MELSVQSHVAIHVDRFPLAPAPFPDDSSWPDIALNVGGDFELLFTVPPACAPAITALGGIICGELSETTRVPTVEWADRKIDVAIHPWEHFRRSEWIDRLRSYVWK